MTFDDKVKKSVPSFTEQVNQIRKNKGGKLIKIPELYEFVPRKIGTPDNVVIYKPSCILDFTDSNPKFNVWVWASEDYVDITGIMTKIEVEFNILNGEYITRYIAQQPDIMGKSVFEYPGRVSNVNSNTHIEDYHIREAVDSTYLAFINAYQTGI